MRVPLRYGLQLAIILLLSTVASVAAHAELVRSDPTPGERLAQSPTGVRLWFDEELDTRQSTLQVFEVDDRQVDLGDGHVDLDDPDHASMIVTLPPLADGVYVVRWQAVTLDDDGVTDGEFDFLVGDAQPRARSAAPTATAGAEWLLTVVPIMIVAGIAAWRKVART